jgi:hypothetical protein
LREVFDSTSPSVDNLWTCEQVRREGIALVTHVLAQELRVLTGQIGRGKSWVLGEDRFSGVHINRLLNCAQIRMELMWITKDRRWTCRTRICDSPVAQTRFDQGLQWYRARECLRHRRSRCSRRCGACPMRPRSAGDLTLRRFSAVSFAHRCPELLACRLAREGIGQR